MRRFTNSGRVVKIDQRTNRTLERHVVQRVLRAQHSKIPLSAQQKRRKKYYAWLSSNSHDPRPDRRVYYIHF